MGIKLSIEITSPLDEQDRDLLSGVAVMTLAIANHEMARNAFPDAFGGEEENPTENPTETGDETPTETPAPCALVNPDDATLICIAKVGHRGRHKFRQMSPEDAEVAASLPN